MLTNKEILTTTTRASLKGSWGFLILAVLIYGILKYLIEETASYIISFTIFPDFDYADIYSKRTPIMVSVLHSFISIIGTAPLGIGYYKIFLDWNRTEGGSKQFTTIFWGFKHTFLSSIVTSIVATVVIILGFVLLIIPGIIFLLAYAPIYFILADEQYKAYNPLLLSKHFMKGKKKQLFLIWLVFIALVLLSIFTLGIALLWITPYFYVVSAKFYTEIEADFLEMNNGSIPETYLRKSHRDIRL